MVKLGAIRNLAVAILLPLFWLAAGATAGGGVSEKNHSLLSITMGCVETEPGLHSFVTNNMRDAVVGFLGPDHETARVWFSAGLFQPAVPLQAAPESFLWLRSETLPDGSSLRYGADIDDGQEVLKVSVAGASFYLVPNDPKEHHLVLSVARSYRRGGCEGARTELPISAEEPGIIWPD